TLSLGCAPFAEQRRAACTVSPIHAPVAAAGAGTRMLAGVDTTKVGSEQRCALDVPAIQGGRDAQLPPNPAILDGAPHAHLLGRDARRAGGRLPGAVAHLGPDERQL